MVADNDGTDASLIIKPMSDDGHRVKSLMISFFSGKKEKNLNELKQELEIDVHRVSADSLEHCRVFFNQLRFLITLEFLSR